MKSKNKPTARTHLKPQKGTRPRQTQSSTDISCEQKTLESPAHPASHQIKH